MRTRLAMLVAITVMLAVGSAHAWELCPKCRGRAYTEDIGTCTSCGGDTASGQFSLCAACARKLNKCCHCGAPLAAGNFVAKPEAAHARLTASRAKALKADLDAFQLELHYLGQQDKPFYTLHLQTQPVKAGVKQLAFAPVVQIDKDRAGKIVDHLGASGILGHARDAAEPTKADKVISAYLLTVAGPDKLTLTQNLGWGPTLIEKLDALRATLGDTDAGKKMDLLLGRIAYLRKK